MPRMKVVLPSLDGIDEAVAGLYVQQGDKFVLDIEGVDDHPSVIALKGGHTNSKRERDEARRELTTLKQKLAAYPEDFDPENYQRLLTEEEARKNDPNNKDVRTQIEAATNATKQQYETKLTNEKRKHDGELKARDEKIAGLEGTVRKLLVDEGLTKSLTEAGVAPHFLKGAKALLASQVEVVEEDGEFVAKMKADAGGDDIGKYVANWVQGDEGKAYVVPAAGGGAKGNNGQGSNKPGEVNPFKRESWNKTLQGTLLGQDRGKAERYAKQAGFTDLDSATKSIDPLPAAVK